MPEIKVAQERDVLSAAADLQFQSQELGARILDKGDVIDRLRWLKHMPTVGATALVGAGVVGAHEGLIAYGWLNYSLELSGVGAGAITLSTAALANAVKPINRRLEARRARPIIRSHEALSEHFEGESVEIYRLGGGRKRNRELAVFWEGSDTNEEYSSSIAHSRLTSLLTVAEGSGAKTVVAPKSAVAEYLHDVPDESLAEMSRNEWLRNKKKTRVTDPVHGDEPVIVINTDTLPKIVENTRLATSEEPLHSVMQLLARVKPGHPLLRSYYPGIKTDSEAANAFEIKVRRAVDKYLLDTEMGWQIEEGADAVPRAKQKSSLIGRTTIRPNERPSISWQKANEFGYSERGDLLRHFGVTEAELENLGELAATLPSHRLVKLCEVAALLTMHDRLSLAEVEGGRKIIGRPAPEGEKSTDSVGLQTRTAETVLNKTLSSADERAEEVSLKSIKRRRVGRSIARLGLALVAGMGVGYASQQYIGVVASHIDAINPDFTKTPSEADLAKIHKLEHSPLYQQLNQASNLSYDLEQNLLNEISKLHRATSKKYTSDELGRLQLQSGAQSGTLGSDANTGNVAIGPNKPVWYLTPYNSMSTAGYWSEKTFRHSFEAQWSKDEVDYKQIYDKDYKTGDPAFDKHIKQLVDTMPELPLPEGLDKTGPLVKVQRLLEIRPKDYWSTQGAKAYDEYGFSSNYFLVTVPTLEGTKLVAASADEKTRLHLKTLPDGTSALMMQGSDKPQVLEYWLAPDKGKKVVATAPVNEYIEGTKPQPKNTPATLPTIGSNGGHYQALSPHLFDSEWAAHLGQQLPTDPKARLAEEEHYIESFDYRLAPLPEADTFTDDITSKRRKFVDYVLDHKKANCNIANTVLVLSNPELNYDIGYHNNNTPDQEKRGTEYLSSGESHAWGVDSTGKIEDATPPNNLLPKEAKQFKEDFTDKFSTPADKKANQTKHIIELASEGASLASAVWQRKRLKQLYRQARKSYAATRLSLTDSRKVSLAFHAANHALYSGEDAHLDDQALEQLKTEPILAGEQLTDKYREYFSSHPDSRQLRRTIKRASAGSSPAGRRSLRRANRVTRLVQTLDKNK